MSFDSNEFDQFTPRLAVRPEDACRLLSISRAHLYRLIQSGDVPSFRVGRVRLLSVDALQRWVDQQSGS